VPRLRGRRRGRGVRRVPEHHHPHPAAVPDPRGRAWPDRPVPPARPQAARGPHPALGPPARRDHRGADRVARRGGRRALRSSCGSSWSTSSAWSSTHDPSHQRRQRGQPRRHRRCPRPAGSVLWQSCWPIPGSGLARERRW